MLHNPNISEDVYENHQIYVKLTLNKLCNYKEWIGSKDILKLNLAISLSLDDCHSKRRIRHKIQCASSVNHTFCKISGLARFTCIFIALNIVISYCKFIFPVLQKDKSKNTLLCGVTGLLYRRTLCQGYNIFLQFSRISGEKNH
jgi:hypothetical protein